jgi:hypothetical protein
MGVLTPIGDAGLTASLTVDGRLQIFGDISLLDKQEAEKLYHYIKQNKHLIIAALSQSSAPGQCESCPAAGYWDNIKYARQGMLCFFDTFYRGKSGKPKPCTSIRSQCPRLNRL